MSGHTKGPWKVGGDDESMWVTGPDESVNVVCDIVVRDLSTWATDEDEANAALIAAAPEMLEVLKVYAEFDNCSNVDDRGTCTPERQCICCRARAAAAKAEGRQP